VAGDDGAYTDLTRVVLADLRLRAGERFTNTYNHFAGWEHELRVEIVGPARSRCRYPRCVGGQHPCPPGWCSGPELLDEIRRDLLGLGYAEDLDLMLAFGRAVLDARDGTVREALLAGFDRHRANRALARLGTPTAEAAHDDPVHLDPGR
jgi:hypothetical protein